MQGHEFSKICVNITHHFRNMSKTGVQKWNTNVHALRKLKGSTGHKSDLKKSAAVEEEIKLSVKQRML